MAMRNAVLATALAALAACASADGGLNIAAMQQRLDDAGIGFGITRAPGSNAALFQIRFRTSEADDAPAPDFRAAAEAAAPDGCTLASLEPAGEGAMKATYDCDQRLEITS
ncbi:MAG: hypothetical protein GC206_06530 [Alphaproteobacteria bacterium]|nr:hypothetical protein [Alphaproteobacteria bacterium]